MRPIRLATAAGAALCAAGLLLTSCSSSGKPSAATSSAGPSTSASPGTKASSYPGSTLTAASSIPPATGNKVALRKQVTQTGCAATTGGWQVSGTVHNTGATRSYTILTYFTTSRATVIDSVTTVVHLGAGKTVAWHASKKFATAPGMRCAIVKVT
jgi:hypothetical protein